MVFKSEVVEIGPSLSVYVTNTMIGSNTLVLDFSGAAFPVVALDEDHFHKLLIALQSFDGLVEEGIGYAKGGPK